MSTDDGTRPSDAVHPGELDAGPPLRTAPDREAPFDATVEAHDHQLVPDDPGRASLGPFDLRDRRRVAVVAATTLLGAVGLAFSLRIAPGDPAFLPAAYSLAAIWGLGGLLAGGQRLGRVPRPDGRGTWAPIIPGIVVGIVLFVICAVGAAILLLIPPLRGPVETLLAHAATPTLGAVWLLTVANGITEELFFRGAVYQVFTRRWRIVGTALLYTLVTAASGIVMLVLAGLILSVVTGLQRRATGGVLAPVLTHITWSSGMLFFLPPLLQLLR